jgi:hypothetical protein
VLHFVHNRVRWVSRDPRLACFISDLWAEKGCMSARNIWIQQSFQTRFEITRKLTNAVEEGGNASPGMFGASDSLMLGY